MKFPVLRKPWLPVVTCVILADVNFWYWVSTEENDADLVGLAFFALFAIYWSWSFIRHRRLREAISGSGAIAAAVLMTLRLREIYDPGYIPPYLVFIAFVLIGFGIGPPKSPSS